MTRQELNQLKIKTYEYWMNIIENHSEYMTDELEEYLTKTDGYVDPFCKEMMLWTEYGGECAGFKCPYFKTYLTRCYEKGQPFDFEAPITAGTIKKYVDLLMEVKL